MEQHIQPVPGKKQKTPVQVEKGRVYITATFNNTLVTVASDKGNTIAWSSAGSRGFKGTRKSTPYAATVVVQTTVQKAIEQHRLREVSVYIKGIGPGRSASLRAIKAIGLDVSKILDITPIPHNGVRPPKMRKG